MRDITAVAFDLALLSLLGIWAMALLDVITRHDMPVTHKLLLVGVMVVVMPVAVVYVLGRPVTAVRRSRVLPEDWRVDLVSRLEDGSNPGAVSDGEDLATVHELADRVRRSLRGEVAAES